MVVIDAEAVTYVLWLIVAAIWGYVGAMILANAVIPDLTDAYRRSRFVQWRQRREFERWYRSLSPAERVRADRLSEQLGEMARGCGISAAEATEALARVLTR